MSRRIGAFATLIVAVALLSPASPVGAGNRTQGASVDGTGEFVVFYGAGVSGAQARAAVAAAGGTVVDEIAALGIARVTTDNAGFSSQVTAAGAVRAVVRNHSVGLERSGMVHRFAAERALEDRAAFAAGGPNQPDGVPNGPKDKDAGPETFSWLQWNMDMIGATLDQAHQTATGDGVLVGIIDTGIDGHHPDLAPNFNGALSRNFTTDIPDIDGPCEVPLVPGSGGHRRRRARDPCGGHRGRGIQRVRDLRRRARRDAGEHPSRPGFRFLLLLRNDRGDRVRGRQRDRCGEHELLHRPLALQLPVGRRLRTGWAAHGGGDRAAGHDPCGNPRRGRLRPQPGRNPCLFCWEPARGPCGADPLRRHQPRLPGRHGTRAHRHQQLPRPAFRGTRRHPGVGHRPVNRQGRLFGVGSRRRSTWPRPAAGSATTSVPRTSASRRT